MIRAGVGCSSAHNPRIAATEAASEAMAQAGLSSATGAICFVTSAHGAAFPLIVRTVAERARTAEIAGCSSMGVIAGEREIESGTAVCVVVFGGEEISARRFFVPSIRRRGRDSALEVAAAVRPALGRSNLLCLFPDSYNLEAEPFLATLATELPGVTTVGGGATEDGSIGETFQFCGDSVSSNSISGMILTGDFEVNQGASLACSQVGPIHRVTAVRDNVILTLDERPAYEVFAEAAGPLADDVRRAIAFVFAGIPMDPEAERLERGKFVVRNIVGASAEHGVIALAHYPKLGDRIGIVLRTAERAREDLKTMLEEMRGSVRKPPAFGLYFDCVSRGSGLYNLQGHDSAYIRRYLGPVPVGGFFTGFEIGPLGAASGLLQYSGVLVTVGEK